MSAHNEPRLNLTSTVRLAPDFTERVLPAHGWATLTDCARDAGLSHTTLLRISKGETEPGPRAIAALIDATGDPFERLFVVAPRSAGAPAQVRPVAGGHPCQRCGIPIAPPAVLCGDCTEALS